MDELIELVMKKAKLNKTTATTVVNTVIGFIKDKLPAGLAGQLDNVLENDAVMDQADDLLDKGADLLGGLLNKKK